MEALRAVELRTQVIEVELIIATLAELIMGLQVLGVFLFRILEEWQLFFQAADALLPR